MSMEYGVAKDGTSLGIWLFAFSFSVLFAFHHVIRFLFILVSRPFVHSTVITNFVLIVKIVTQVVSEL
jgi:hypothetical protein